MPEGAGLLTVVGAAKGRVACACAMARGLASRLARDTVSPHANARAPDSRLENPRFIDYFSLRMRSAGLITSVSRMPNFSFTTTTSP